MTEQEIVNVLPQDLPNNHEPNAYEPALNIAGRVNKMQNKVDNVDAQIGQGEVATPPVSH